MGGGSCAVAVPIIGALGPPALAQGNSSTLGIQANHQLQVENTADGELGRLLGVELAPLKTGAKCRRRSAGALATDRDAAGVARPLLPRS